MIRIRRATAALSVAILTPLLVATQPAPAIAATGEMHQCTTPEIQNGKTMSTVDLKRVKFGMTHSTRRRIPPGAEFERSVEMAEQNVIEASASASVTASTEAGALFAKASVEANVTVAGRAEKTTSQTITERFTFPPARRERLVVFYAGVDTFGFRAHVRKCSRAGQKDYYGSLFSFNEVYESGAVLCPSSRYRKGTISYQVTRSSGC